ncbi:pentatricopeptide repeat-containing protein At3g09040, mitochondrial [Prosopis cineraria]|uniref:pentatricopeptide repeat-containing protein At3g09040, mitochondrial n=1 Tax=Prosopis cineraria TaxID=364024 RepID=UPI002410B302|nr:pentatricopeptide repeat-containing protein At3g09040, mitochondrial [Prosopis cineraria]
MHVKLKCSFRSLVASNSVLCHYYLTLPSILHYSTIPHNPNSEEHHLYDHLLQSCLRQCRQIKYHYLFDEISGRRSLVSRISKVIHAHSIKNGIGSEGLLGNAVVDLYAKCGNLGFAEKVFDQLDNKDLLAWNSLLVMYSRNGLLERVLQCIGSLRDYGQLPNEFTCAIALSVCAKLKNVEYGRFVHCWVIKGGFSSFSVCKGSLIDLYAKCNCMRDAQKVFDGALNLDIVSWTAIISGYIQDGLLEEAIKMFEKMLKSGLDPDQVICITIMNAFLSLGRVKDACELFKQMPTRNVVAWNVMISDHVRRGCNEVAISYFTEMRKDGIKSSRSTLGSVLSAIASLEALDYGLLVHAEAIKQGLDNNVYVGSSLINMYGKCFMLDAAKQVFDAIDEKNIVIWNAMLGGYAQNDYVDEVMDLFFCMMRCGMDLDEFTYTSILSSCSCPKYQEMGRQLHSVIVKKRFTTNLFVNNALIDMYAKAGVLKEARKLFELMPSRDNISWNAIIVGYVQQEDEAEAFNLFQRMISHGIVADEVSLTSMLSACGNVKALEGGKQVHCLSFKLGLERRLCAGSALIDMYSKCGAIGDAQKVFSSMPEWSVVSLNSLISGYVQKNTKEAFNLLHKMLIMGLEPSEVTFASLIDACRPQNITLGLQIHCVILKRGLLCGSEFLGVSLLGMYMDSQRIADANILFSEFLNLKSTVLWTALISGHTQNDCSEEALTLFWKMRENYILPDQATFVSVLRACAILSSLQDGNKIHSLIFHTGFDSDELTSGALIDMYAKCGDVRSSEQVFKEVSSKNNVISWNSMIVGFAKNGYAGNALDIFNEMTQSSVMPDDVTFLGVLTACSHAGWVPEGRQIFDMMINQYGIQPRVDHYACMVDLLGRWGFLKEAEEFIDKLDVESNARIWASLLGACRIHGDEKRGQQAAENLIKLEPQNSSPYILLSNIYAASGHWNEARSLRRTMREKEVQKMPGFSWIVVGQNTNIFVAGDKSHYSSDEIYETLKHLTALMREDRFQEGGTFQVAQI